MTIIVRISALVHPTEVLEKVKTAVTNLFQIELEQEELEIPRLCGEGSLESLRKLHLRLRECRILDTARNVLLSGIEDNTTQFCLNKQAGFVGKLNFSSGDESLGALYVEISAANKKDLLQVIDWLAPQTIKGMPVEEIEL